MRVSLTLLFPEHQLPSAKASNVICVWFISLEIFYALVRKCVCTAPPLFVTQMEVYWMHPFPFVLFWYFPPNLATYFGDYPISVH